jgi:hypothetical protein
MNQNRIKGDCHPIIAVEKKQQLKKGNTLNFLSYFDTILQHFLKIIKLLPYYLQ